MNIYVTEDKQQIKEWMSLKQAHVLFPSEVEKFLRNLYCSTETHSAQVDARQMWSSLGLYPPLNRKRKDSFECPTQIHVRTKNHFSHGYFINLRLATYPTIARGISCINSSHY